MQHSQRLLEGQAYSSDRKARQPNLAYFAVASVTAGLATLLYMEGQVMLIVKRVLHLGHMHSKSACAEWCYRFRTRAETRQARVPGCQTCSTARKQLPLAHTPCG